MDEAMAAKMQMPKIMYGTAWKKERTTALVTHAITAGFRGIDTACQPKVRWLRVMILIRSARHLPYGHGVMLIGREDLVGEAIAGAISSGLVKRENLFIQTKFTSIDGQDRSQPLPYDPSSSISAQVASSVGTSLRHLRTPYIDSVVLHSPLRSREQTLEAYRALEAAVGAGTVRQLGVSNLYDADELAWLLGQARVKVGVVQNRWYEGNGWDWGVYDLCQKEGIRYQSFWTLTGSPSLLKHPRLRALAKRAGITPEQAVYKLCQVWNITPLCGSTTPSHVQEALAVETAGISADDEDVRELWRLMRGEA